MLTLILATIGFRPFSTFMEGLINCIIWVTGILALISYYLFTIGLLKGVGNKACTYLVAALTFVVMFAVIVHTLLGIYSKERKEMRERKPMQTLPVSVSSISLIEKESETPSAQLRASAPPTPPPVPGTLEEPGVLDTFISTLTTFVRLHTLKKKNNGT
jgi:hypothetical protein